MARGNKSGSKDDLRRTAAQGLTPAKYHEFRDEVAELYSSKAASATAYMSKFKECESRGIHPKVFPVIQRLERMDTLTRNAWLADFDRQRSFMTHWTAQGNMFDEQPDQADPDEVDERQEPLFKDDGEMGAEPEAETGATRGPAEDKVDGPEVEEGPSLTLPPDEDALINGPVAFEAGRIAGHDGVSYQDNPHQITDAMHAIWERGRAKGAEQVAQGLPKHEEIPVEEIPAAIVPRRSRSRKAVDGASVH